MEHTGDGEVADELVRILSIDDIVHKIDLGIFTANHGCHVEMLKAIEGTGGLQRLRVLSGLRLEVRSQSRLRGGGSSGRHFG